MKATAKPFLFKERVKSNGKYPVKIKVTFKRAKRFYDIGIDMTEKEFGEYHVNRKLKNLFDDITYYLKRATDIIDTLKDGFSFPIFRQTFYKTQTTELVINALPNNINFLAYSNYQIERLKNEKRLKTADSYQCSHNKLNGFIGGADIPFTHITKDFLNRFDEYMSLKGLSQTTIGIYMRNIRSIFNQAIAAKLVAKDQYPFGSGGYSPRAGKKAKKALRVEDIGLIYNYIPVSNIEAWAKDMWLFAYFANGINIKDMALLRYNDIKSGEIRFTRAKTKKSTQEPKEISIVVIEEMQAIIDKWGNKPKTENHYIFDIISVQKGATAEQIFRDVNKAIKLINKYIARIAAQLGLPRRPTTNFARHSFATVLKRSGIPIEMISEQLGHTSVTTTEIYLDSFEKEQRLELSKHLTSFKVRAIAH